MSVRQAAVQVLRDAGGPLTAKEIASRILGRGLWKSRGKTPHATVAARLYADIKKNGDQSAFVHVGSNVFSFREGVTSAAPFISLLLSRLLSNSDYAASHCGEYLHLGLR